MEFYEMMGKADEVIMAFFEEGNKEAIKEFPVAEVKAGLTDANPVVREECEDLRYSYEKMMEALA